MWPPLPQPVRLRPRHHKANVLTSSFIHTRSLVPLISRYVLSKPQRRDKSTTYRLYMLKYRYVCVTIIPYSIMLNTKPTKIGP